MPEPAYWCKQKCPFCDEDKIVIANGIIGTAEKPKMVYDRGYSFCNCKNIWFTDWKNIDQELYRGDTVEKNHSTNDNYKKGIKEVFQHHLKYQTVHNKGCDNNKFLDLGSITPTVLDEAKRLGFETTGVDMYPRNDFGHAMIQGDFEVMNICDKYDLIWASHIFEHFKYPLKALEKCYDLLGEGGELFIAMPDPFFIDFMNIHNFSHFLLRSHHIIWDMDSFVEEAEKIGFKVGLKRRNFIVNVISDMHIVLIRGDKVDLTKSMYKDINMVIKR